MRAFFLRHIDALISIGIGRGLSVYAWLHRVPLFSSPKKLMHALPVLVSLLLVACDSKPQNSWHRVFTSDRQASAEFPSATTVKTVTDSALGISIRRETVNCDVPRRDINLHLSYNEIPPEGANLTDEQRMGGLKQFFQQQGFTVTSCIPDVHGGVSGYRILLESDRGKVHCQVRVVITKKAIYRAMATSTTGFHDDPVIPHFLNSFKTE